VATDHSDRGTTAALAARRAEWLGALAAESGLAKNTLAAYRRDLTRAQEFLTARGLRRWEDLTPDLLAKLLADTRARGAAPASQQRLLSSLRGFYRWLRAEGLHDGRDPTRGAGRLRLWDRLPRVLAPEDALRLLDAPSADTALGQRDRALLALLYGGGLRVSEAAGLRMDALSLRAHAEDRAAGLLRVIGKGDKERLAPFGGEARRRVEQWIAEGRARLAPRCDRLLVTKSGRPLDRHRAFRIVQEAAARAGLREAVHPHTLRHSCATHLLLGGGDLRAVQEFLGHADLRTTERYTHVEAEQLQALHRLHHPRG
jgi:integrase/recombinase XerD